MLGSVGIQSSFDTRSPRPVLDSNAPMLYDKALPMYAVWQSAAAQGICLNIRQPTQPALLSDPVLQLHAKVHA